MQNGKTVLFHSWELELDSGVLRAHGEVVRLQPQPAKVLCLLAGRPGELVTRAEIQKTLWNGDTFVDFDGGLNYCIRQIRSVLGDSAEQPVFIETVPRRGYRFVADVLPPTQVLPSLVDQPHKQFKIRKVAQPAITRAIAASILFAIAITTGVWLRSRHATPAASTPHVTSYTRLTDDGRLKDVGTSFDPLVAVGDKIFFNETMGNHSLLATAPMAGGDVSLLPAPFASAGIVDYSDATRELLFASVGHILPDQSLVAESLTTHISHPLSGVTAHDARWSSDGKTLAFAKGSDVFVADHNGNGARKVASVSGPAFWLRWSPDGRAIRFSENPEGYRAHLWEVNADGTNQHMLLGDTSERDHICCGSWIRNGRYFVYLSLELNRSDLWVVATDGKSFPARLTAGPLDFWRGPLPSPDGQHVFAIGEQMRGRLVRVDPVTRKPVKYLNEISAEGVSFSPDGEWIAYSAFPEGSLWRSRIDGSSKLQLTAAPMLARFPRWSPDGKTIAFTAATPGSAWRIYTASAMSGGLHRVLDDPADQGVPSWSADGRYLAFGGLPGIARSQKLAIQILNLADGSLSTLPHSEGLWTPRWSPDGKYFVAVDSERKLHLYELETRAWSILAELGANDIVWSRDSRFLFFDEAYGAKPAIYRVRLADRKVELWADLTEFRRAGFFAPWLGISPDGSPTLLADVSIQEVYSLSVALP